MNINDQTRFNQVYQAYLNELTLQGKSPKTVDMYQGRITLKVINSRILIT